jgi:NADPH-dependent FMN reductase
MSDVKVLALVGSLRAASVNRQIAGLVAARAPAGIEVNLYRGLGGGLGELPLYNGDIDNPGADVVDAPAFSLPIDALGGKHPRESDDVVARLNDVLTKLTAEVG